jgi:TFIIF-interacting CTD phosphatase-like protein
MCTNNKILLILDLDETLIYSSEKKLDRNPEFIFEQYYVYLRPHLEQFLNELAPNFSLAIWSSGNDAYVEYIVNKIKPDSIEFEFVWGRSKCTPRRDLEVDEYFFEKKLKKVKKFGHSLEKILIVDDTSQKARSNYGNAIYSDEYKGEPDDTMLPNLCRYLKTLSQVENVRKIEKRGWRSG